MKRHRRPTHGIWLLAGSALLFMALLGLRLDWFSRPQTPAVTPPAAASPHETWMVIEQGGRPIGHAHSLLSTTTEGHRLEERSQMRITTMGLSQAIALSTRADLAADLSLRRFAFDLRSGLFAFQAEGAVEGGRLTVSVGGRSSQWPLEEPIYLAGAVLPAAGRGELAPGAVRRLSVFDPAAMGRRPLEIRMEGDERLNVAGEWIATRRLALTYAGVTQKAWVTPQGEVVQEEGLLGIRLRKVTRAEALTAAQGGASEDLTRLVAIPSNRPLPDARERERLTVRLAGLPEGLALEGGRQRWDPRNMVLTVRRETLGPPSPTEDSTVDPPEPEALLPAPLIESDHPAVRRLADALVAPADPPAVRIGKLMAWIAANIEKRPVLSLPSASATLEARMGDCNEHAALLAALARAAGVPAVIEAGLVYTEGRFFYHAWNALWLDRWVTADPLMNQLPADATHIRLVRGDPDRQLDLLAAIGRTTLTVLED